MPGMAWLSAPTWNTWAKAADAGQVGAIALAKMKGKKWARVAYTRPLRVFGCYDAASTSQVTVCGKRITMMRAMPCSTMNGNAPLWMSAVFTSGGATLCR